MRTEEATSSILSEVWSQVQPQIQKARYLEEAAQALATSLYTQFDESVVIARIFVTVPFNSLPGANKEFVRNLAEAAGAASDLKPGTPVLSLIGTHGQEEDWNDRRKSKGHVGIPLISSAFVDTIPMISRLLKELGVPLEWLDSHDAQIIVQSRDGAEALFFVDDALQAADEEGRKIISAQDFVSSYQVKSVFGTGGVYASGQIFVIVVFCCDSFARADAERFLALTQSFKNETASFSSSGSIFSLVGQTLSHYRILEKIGEGGMGEVYRAEDTNLDREVAIKVLPEQFTQDPQRLARFEREAKLLAQLNHPNIAAIYGFEKADGVHFLALELVKGETLAERVAKGPLPVDEALEVCRQIAEGVEAAHEKGVIHRDLKPANVKVTPEGKVKILDFGLAKAFEEEIPDEDMSQSPTLTEEMTRAGVILGTAAYMSPEQAKGKPVDKRTDIWTFGCVLFECLTGKSAFEGETITQTIAAVFTDNPQWDALPENTPWNIRTLLLRCFEKEANRRLRGMGDAKFEIEKALAEPTMLSPIGVPRVVQSSLWRRAIPWSIALVIAVILGIATRILTSPVPQPPIKFVITPPPTAPLASGGSLDLAIAPNGKRIIYRAFAGGTVQLYLRSLDELIATPISGTEGAESPFFSPDGDSVAFFAAGKLKKVSLMGGTAVTLCDAPNPGRSGSWGSEDMIVFSAGSESVLSLFRVSTGGGTPEILAGPDLDKGELDYHAPEILPGGKAVLFTVWLGGANFQIAVLSLETGEQEILIPRGRAAHYTSTGHLVYTTATGTLMAVPFDLARLEVTNDGSPLLEVVRNNIPGFVDYAISADGTLTYVPAGENAERSLVWVDRQGTERLVTRERRNFTLSRIAPDGKRLAVAIMGDDGNRNTWIYDIERDSFSRLTFEGNNGSLIWTPDSKWITFQSNRDGPANLYRRLADGSGPAEHLTTSNFQQDPDSWSPDGSVLVFRENRSGTGRDIWILPMNGDRKPEPLISSPLLDCCARFSPDGKWLAYVSNEMGQHHVYVTPYPEPNVKWLVSGEEGGGGPVWSPDGTEIFYRSGNQMMVVSVQTRPTFSSGKPEVLFEGAYVTSETLPSVSQNYDIHPDGQRFLMIKDDQSAGQINVVLNWFEELKRLVPTD